MTAIDVEVGKAYVCNFNSGLLVGMGLKIALCVGKAANGEVIMRSRQGAMGRGIWAKHPRKCSATCVRREASPREVTVNMPIGPVPEAS